MEVLFYPKHLHNGLYITARCVEIGERLLELLERLLMYTAARRRVGAVGVCCAGIRGHVRELMFEVGKRGLCGSNRGACRACVSDT